MMRKLAGILDPHWRGPGREKKGQRVQKGDLTKVRGAPLGEGEMSPLGQGGVGRWKRLVGLR